MSTHEPDGPAGAEPGLVEESSNGTGPHDDEPEQPSEYVEQQPADEPSEAVVDEERQPVDVPTEAAADEEQPPTDAVADEEQSPTEAAGDEPVTEPDEASPPVVGGDLPPLASALEAVLMIVDEPVPTVQLAQVLETPRTEVDATLRRLSEEYTAAGRGFDLREVAGGWRYYSRTECAPVVERFVLDGQQARLTQAALETLAVVAYRQPVSRARVSAIRGVNCDGVIRTLVSRGLIEEAGTEQESNAILYRTTSYFLERIGVQSVDDLPDIAPYLPEIDELADNEDVAG